MKIIAITAPLRPDPPDIPNIFNIKERASIEMDREEWITPEVISGQQKILCQLKPTFTKEGWVQMLEIFHNDEMLWSHTYLIGEKHPMAKPPWEPIASGGIWAEKLSDIKQTYKLADDPKRMPKDRWESSVRGKALYFPDTEHRGLVEIIENGALRHNGLCSTKIIPSQTNQYECEVCFD